MYSRTQPNRMTHSFPSTLFLLCPGGVVQRGLSFWNILCTSSFSWLNPTGFSRSLCEAQAQVKWPFSLLPKHPRHSPQSLLLLYHIMTACLPVCIRLGALQHHLSTQPHSDRLVLLIMVCNKRSQKNSPNAFISVHRLPAECVTGVAGV